MFKKYESSNNAICFLANPITNTSNTIIASGNVDRFPTENFIIKVTQYSGGILQGRENMYISTRVGNVFNVSERAYEPVPINDTAQENIQQALPFDSGAIIENVNSSEFLKDMQDEVKRLEDDKIDIDGGTREGLTSDSIVWADENGDESFLEFDRVADNGKTLIIDETEGLKLESPAVDIGGLTETTTLDGTDDFLVRTGAGNRKITVNNALNTTKTTFIAGEDITEGNAIRQGLGLSEVPYIITEATNNAGTYRILPNIICHGTNITTLKISIYDGWNNGNFTLRTYRASDDDLLSTKTITRIGNGTYEYTVNLNLTIDVLTEIYFTLQTSYNNQGPRNPLKINFSTPEDATKIYKTSALNKSSVGFIGFATNTVSTGGNVLVDTSGISTTQSGLTTGSDYYLSNTPGAISTTPGTNIVSVGKAVESGILINTFYERNYTATGTSAGTNATSISFTHGLGRVPKIVRIEILGNGDYSNVSRPTSRGLFNGSSYVCIAEAIFNISGSLKNRDFTLTDRIGWLQNENTSSNTNRGTEIRVTTLNNTTITLTNTVNNGSAQPYTYLLYAE